MRLTPSKVLPLILAAGLALAQGQDKAPSFFERILEEAGMSFTLPQGYREAPVIPNPVLVYHHRVENPQKGVEIRYLIAPIGRIEIDYDDPHASAPEPNHIFSLLFPGILTQISIDGRYSEKEYPGLEALRLFGADWAAVGTLTPNPEFAPYAHCVVVAMHKNDRADAFEFFLANDLETLKKEVIAHQAALRFR